ncbi:MAG: DUF4465 domain-containing protein [Alistipes sp.]|nr:DUF4465 domain-containing protein [Alistipes sp.]
MKKISILLSALLAFAACSDDNNGGQKSVELEYVTFEDGTLTDLHGATVVPGDISIRGYIAGDYSGVFWGAEYAEEVPFTGYDGSTGVYSLFDGLLFSTADGTVKFGSYYTDGRNWGMISDVWNGFVVSKNFDDSAVEFDYSTQFSAWAAAGARGSETFLVGFHSEYGTYGAPTVEFAEPRVVDHLYMANSTLVHTYSTQNPDISVATLSVVIRGQRRDGDGYADVYTREVPLIDAAGDKVSAWVKVALAAEPVERLVFSVDSNDSNEYGLLIPGYFCIDEIALVK